MRNLVLVLAIISMFTLAGNAQDKPGRRPFVFVGMGWMPSQDVSYSAEFETWGITKPTSFSITYDAMVHVGGGDHAYSHWIGIKPYFTFYEASKVSYMFYFAPKMNLSEKNSTLIEFGINPNYTLSDDFLLSTTVGA